MLRNLLLIIFLIFLKPVHAQTETLTSPDKQIQIHVHVTDEGLTYQVSYRDKPLIRPSILGFRFKNAPLLQHNLAVLAKEELLVDRQWETVWGEQRFIQNHYNELTLKLKETTPSGRQLNILFRAYDDGIAFRYQFPEQTGIKDVVVTEELTRFAFDQNFQAWWIPAFKDQRYEYQYLKSALSTVDSAQTPITLVSDTVAVAVHEAALLDYPSMTLKNIGDNQITFTADLVPWANGDKAYISAPFSTPWRMIQIADRPVDLLNSKLMLNLNASSDSDTDTSYIKPGKYMGIWWEMHIGEKNWSPGEKQGATTKRAKEYIDFAAKHDIDGVLIEGWNTGWEGEWWQRPPTFSFTQPVKGFDLQAVTDYANRKGVNIIGHHETAAGVTYYEKQMDDAFAYYEALGIHTVKMGYVGTRLDKKEWHHGQFMVRHFNKLVRTAAKYKLMVNAHETIKGTGLSRTFPNMMTREAVRGMEYNGGSPDTGNLPNHTVIIPFTRGLAGPIDFTPGIFEFDYQKYRPHNRVPTTLAKQLALYITLYSPLQMAADLPENYEGHPAFAWIDAVPTDWQESKALAGEIGEFLVVARKDRHSENWYLGATTNEAPRNLTVATDFLTPGQKYKLTRYEDGPDAHWKTNPEDYQIRHQTITAGDVLNIAMKPGGGAAIQLTPIP